MRRGTKWSACALVTGLLFGCGDDGGSANAADDDGGSTGSPDTTPDCGNGILEGDERCEPPINGPAACNPVTCRPQPGYVCEIVVPEGGQSMFMSAVCMEEEDPPVETCGNGVLDEGEACDDFDMNDGDGCSAECELEPDWQCTTDAPTICAQCGDGATLPPLEECDAGDQTVPGCRADCTAEVGWMCTLQTICAPVCGDGLVLDQDDGVPDVYAEACDDGNAITGDGCTAACQVENGWECTGSPSDCVQLFSCGDGVIEGTEECDDGPSNSNIVPDACRSNCRAAHCGDLITDTGEECDDGNTVDDDFCDNLCQYTEEVDCDDGLDEDDDGLTDCEDVDCFGAGGDCDPETVCDDMLDQDVDTDIDCDDIDCINDPACAPSCGQTGDANELNQTPNVATLLGAPTMTYSPSGVLCSADIDHYRLDSFIDPTGCTISVALDLPSLSPAGASIDIRLLDLTNLAVPLATGTLSAADNGPIVFDANGYLQATIIEANTTSMTDVAYTLTVTPTCL